MHVKPDTDALAGQRRAMTRPKLSLLTPLALALALSPGACNCAPSPPIADTGFADASVRRDGARFDAPLADQSRGDVRYLDATVADHSNTDQGTPDASVERDSQVENDGPNPSDAGPDSGEALDSAVLSDATLADLEPVDLGPADLGPFGEVPEAPQNPRSFAGAKVRLRCDPAARAQSYRAYHAYSPDGPFVSIGPDSASPELFVSGLDYGLTHFFVLRAVNNVGVSAPSQVVSALPHDAVSTLRATIHGRVTRAGEPVADAMVRLYSAVDHGLVLGEAHCDAQGLYNLTAPSGFYRGLIAGFDELPQDGNAFELGYDSVGVRLFDSVSGPGFLDLRPGADLDSMDLELGFTFLSQQASGHVDIGVGWPLADVWVEAYQPGSPLRGLRVRTDSSGHFDLFAANDSYSLRAFLDVDGDGEQGVNEPDSAVLVIDLSDGDQDLIDLAIPALATIQGHLSDSDPASRGQWSLNAVDNLSGAVYQRALSREQDYSLQVSAGRSYTVQLYHDQDGSGQRSFFDRDRDGLHSDPQELFSETGLAARSDVNAGETQVDFSLGPWVQIHGQISPAMQPWQVCARSVDGNQLFCGASEPDGQYLLEVEGPDSYLVYAYQDRDGDARPTPGLEPLVLHGAVLDLSQGDPGSVDITARQVEGQLVAPRSAQPSQREMIVVQQLVQGLGGGALCATPLAFNNALSVDDQGRFATLVGAVGSGGGSSTLADCAPDCSGVVLHRAWDLRHNYDVSMTDCERLGVLTYPATPDSPNSPSLVLDSSAGDLLGIAF